MSFFNTCSFLCYCFSFPGSCKYMLHLLSTLLGVGGYRMWGAFKYTSSTAQGGGSFKKTKTIGEIGCCESRILWGLRCRSYEGIGAPLYPLVLQLREGSSARNRRKSSDPLRSALQILRRNWSTPIPLGEARAARGIALVTI